MWPRLGAGRRILEREWPRLSTPGYDSSWAGPNKKPPEGLGSSGLLGVFDQLMREVESHGRGKHGSGAFAAVENIQVIEEVFDRLRCCTETIARDGVGHGWTFQ